MVDKNTDLVDIINEDKPPLKKGDSTESWSIILPHKFNPSNMHYSKDDYLNLSKKIENYNIIFQDMLNLLGYDLSRINATKAFYISTFNYGKDIWVLCNFPETPILSDKCIIDVTAFDKNRDHKQLGREHFALTMKLNEPEKGIFRPEIDIHPSNPGSPIFYNKINNKVMKANSQIADLNK